MLDENLRNEEKLEKFKAGMRSWVKENIRTKPKAKFPNLTTGRVNQQQPPPDPPPLVNDIRRYFLPVQQNALLN